MTRRHFEVLAIACVLIVPVVLARAAVVDAEATHSGTFSTTPTGPTIIYSAVQSAATPVMLTLCQTSGTAQVQIIVDGTTPFTVNGCTTLALTVTRSIQVSSSAASSGVYTLSLDLARLTAP
jgi:hypothetical protein